MEDLQKRFNLHASDYDRYAVPTLSPLADLLLEQIGMNEAMRVLDLCTGTGLLLCKLADLFPSALMVVGADLSEGMLQVARTKAKDNPRASFTAMDAELLGFTSRSFSLITLQFGLGYLDPEKSLREIFRLLEPGGLAAIQAYDTSEAATVPPYRRLTKLFAYILNKYSTRTPSPELEQTRKKMSGSSERDRNMTQQTEKSLKELAQGIGFPDVESRSLTAQFQYADIETFLNSMLTGCTSSSIYYRQEIEEMASEAA